MKNIDVKEIIAVMDELEKERGISKDYLISALEEALGRKVIKTYIYSTHLNKEILL